MRDTTEGVAERAVCMTGKPVETLREAHRVREESHRVFCDLIEAGATFVAWERGRRKSIEAALADPALRDPDNRPEDADGWELEDYHDDKPEVGPAVDNVKYEGLGMVQLWIPAEYLRGNKPPTMRECSYRFDAATGHWYRYCDKGADQPFCKFGPGGDFTQNYTPGQSKRALDRLAADMHAAKTKPCPECGDDMEYEPPCRGEEVVWGVVQRWTDPGVWGCAECGRQEVDE